jgi:hypothetical protein
MVYRGHVKNGVVILENRVTLSEGTLVRIQPLKKPIGPKKSGSKRTLHGQLNVGLKSRRRRKMANGDGLGRRLMKFAGVVKGLPRDMARNHDHYIHGTPRK